MEIQEVTAEVYQSVISNPIHIFNTARFNDLNHSKSESVYYLTFKDTKIRLGLILGLRNNLLLSPFSASFGGFDFVSSDVKLYQIDAALAELISWATTRGFNGIRIVPPPFFYNEDFSAKVTNCMYRAGFETQNLELNYHFQTAVLSDTYEQTIWYNARKNLKKSLSSGLVFEKLATEQGELAYNIIAQNRSERGFPLRLSWAELVRTSAIIPIDFFLVKSATHTIGSAIVFHVAPSIVRIVYWGDLPEFSEYKTMNFLSFHVFSYYQKQGIRVIDIGHSTVDSVPNHGLCEFKESIGCSIGLLYEFYKKLG